MSRRSLGAEQLLYSQRTFADICKDEVIRVPSRGSTELPLKSFPDVVRATVTKDNDTISVISSANSKVVQGVGDRRSSKRKKRRGSSIVMEVLRNSLKKHVNFNLDDGDDSDQCSHNDSFFDNSDFFCQNSSTHHDDSTNQMMCNSSKSLSLNNSTFTKERASNLSLEDSNTSNHSESAEVKNTTTSRRKPRRLSISKKVKSIKDRVKRFRKSRSAVL